MLIRKGVGLFLAAVVVGFLGIKIYGLISAKAEVNPLKQIAPGPLYTDMNDKDGGEVVPFLSMTPKEGLRHPVGFFSALHYRGPIIEDYIKKVIDAGKAESLEIRLNSFGKGKLWPAIKEIDQTLAFLGVAADKGYKNARETLDSMKKGSVTVHYGTEKETEEKIKYKNAAKTIAGGKGFVSSVSKGPVIKTYFILRKDFPALAKLVDEQQAAVRARRLLVKKKIEELFKKYGMKIFKK